MKLFVLTPVYSISTSKQGATPVVHYFTREWVKMGHDVVVFQFVAKFPRPLYWFGNLFQRRLYSRLGIPIPMAAPKDEDYVVEGVTVHKRCLNKFVPHSKYKKIQLTRAIKVIATEIACNGMPDWFVGHWDNPQLELLDALKKRFGKPTCLVFHDNHFNFEKKYGEEGLKMLSNLDVIGFRSIVGKRRFEKQYGKMHHCFIASSGVSEAFLMAGAQDHRIVTPPVRSFVYVGSLIERKYPSAIVEALSQVYPNGDFTITYIGDGAERRIIEEEHRRWGGRGEVRFTGRIPREEIIEYLRKADVFVMISKAEIFGLVYLEAMALGVIPIGSRNEGIDGIIRDGENGFLCEAGDVNGLTAVLKRIQQMSMEEMREMSQNAKKTAMDYSDQKVAQHYLDELKAH